MENNDTSLNGMALEDFIPEPGEFSVAALGGHTIRLRPVSLEDELWIQKNLPQLETAFKKLRLGELVRLVFRLMDDESKALLKKQTVKEMQEDGSEKDVELGGVELLSRVVRGPERLTMVNALLKILGASRAVAEAEKKRLAKEDLEVKNQAQTSTGETSLTPLLQSTDGQ